MKFIRSSILIYDRERESRAHGTLATMESMAGASSESSKNEFIAIVRTLIVSFNSDRAMHSSLPSWLNEWVAAHETLSFLSLPFLS